MDIENKSYFMYENIYCDKYNVYWMFAYDFNGLFSMKGDRISYIMSLKEYPFDSIRLFGAISGVGDKIVLAPTRADNIIIYDSKTYEYEMIPVCDIEEKYDKNAKFFSVARYKDCLYLIGHCYPAIVKVNPSNGITNYYYLKEYDGFGEWNGGDIFRKDFILKDNLIFIPCAFSNKVFIFNFDTGEGSFNTVGPSSMKYSGICSDGSICWLSPIYGNTMIRWEKDTNKYEEIVLRGNEQRDNRLSYVGCLFFKGNVYVIPAYKNKLVIMDIRNETQEVFDVLGKNCPTISPIRCYYIKDDNMVLVSAYEGEHCRVVRDNEKKYRLEEITICGSLQVFKKMYKENVSGVSEPIEEKSFFNLNDLFDVIKNSDKKCFDGENSDRIGCAIWKNIY